MPQPIPDYVPGPIRDLVASRHKDTGVRGFAESAGFTYTSLLYMLKSRNHVSLRTWNDFCKQLEIDPETAAIRWLTLESDERRAAIKEAIQEKFGSVQRMHFEQAASEGYLSKLLNSEAANKIIKKYIPLAKSTGVTLEQLEALLCE